MPITRRALLASAAAALHAAPRPAMGLSTDCFPSRSHPKTALGFLEFCHDLGAAGAQSVLDSTDAAYLKSIRRRVDEWDMYWQPSVALPREDITAFENTVRAAKEAGATCLRSVCLGGRRYEMFGSLEEWKRFVADARARLARAVPIAEKHKITLGIENHKDWTLEEFLPLLKEYSSEYLGVCLDTGNNISLLDDNRELIERLAPYTTNAHIKDMAVAAYPDGFLLVEVPFGEGLLDVRWMVETIRRHRPRINLTLEMMTRSPLKVPCLTEKYWATFTERNGRYLARTLRMVRDNPPRAPLPQVDGLPPEERFALETENVRKCLAWARAHFGT
jgi:sugar phosphate isomerase/epimerase